MSQILKLRGAIKSYDWGKSGKESCVAKLYQSSFQDFEIKSDVSYAELWMGTHPSGPATIPEKDCTLLDWIEKNPQTLGDKVTINFGATGLPFLFKVLSVKQPLSIQAHPDKKTAEKLHSSHPTLYPDSNHKPEMAIALTKFELLCGFRPITDIKAFVCELEPLKNLLSPDIFFALSYCTAYSDKDLMKSVFISIMTREEDESKKQLASLIDIMKQDSLSKECKAISEVFLTICSHYPGDIGCFAIFLMNYITLEPGEALFVNANEPHCYLLGDCIECMACSDNVVRAGLTPKFKDVNTLCSILTFDCKSVEDTIFNPVKKDSFLTIYKPPVNEFVVDKLILPSKTSYDLSMLDVAAIILVVEGSGVIKEVNVTDSKDIEMNPGVILFAPCNSHIKFEAKSNALVFRAYCDPF